MRRVLLSVLFAAALTSLTGCPAKPKSGECKTSQDCLAQEGFGKICVEGRCQECGQDSDCKEGFVCRGNKCVPKPECQADADCGPGRRCENERCVARREEAAAPAPTAGPSVPPECADAASFTIHFAFDKSTLTPESQGTLQKLAGCLKTAPARKVVVEGHCDERGTTQYNIALGSRRAEAAKKYLGDLGTSGSMDTVSYGKEKPVCTQSSEDCWAKNRRAQFEVDR
ncbi:MAG TPA: OmpA family protein [Anaeromyxobacter sp.]